MAFRFIDLFAGLGGFHIAAQKHSGECVLACEIEPELRELYKTNFGHQPFCDVRHLSQNQVPKHDVLFAGFPCQPFSKAGEQRGWRDAIRGTLFWDIVRIAEARMPRVLLLENVANFQYHDGGNTFKKTVTALQKLGYSTFFCKLSPHQFGIPQIRERVYIVGLLSPKEPFTWPTPTTSINDLSVREVLEVRPGDAVPLSKHYAECLEVWQDLLDVIPISEKVPSFPIWSMEFGATYPITFDSIEEIPLADLRKCKGSFGTSMAGATRRNVASLLPPYAQARDNAFPNWKRRFIVQNREFFTRNRTFLQRWKAKIETFAPSLQKFEWNCQGAERVISQCLIQFRASGVRVKHPRTAPSLVAMTATQVPVVGWESRHLTLRECARLQSIDGLRVLPPGRFGFKALGNAVNSEVASRVLGAALRCV